MSNVLVCDVPDGYPPDHRGCTCYGLAPTVPVYRHRDNHLPSCAIHTKPPAAMTANPADAVREALERLRAFLAHQSYSDGADPLDDLDTLAAHITALTEAQREAFQQYVDANEARIDAEARLAALAGAGPEPVAWAEDTPYGRGYRFAPELISYMDNRDPEPPHAPAKAREDGIAKIIDSMEHDAADIRLGRQWMSACEHYLPKLRALATFAEGA